MEKVEGVFGIEKRHEELDVIAMLEDDRVSNSVNDILIELARAERIHSWPVEIAHQYLIVAEENGEMAKALNDYLFKPPEFQSKYLEELRVETIQTAAMCIRFLKHLGGKR
jgi:hypothetical protein